MRTVTGPESGRCFGCFRPQRDCFCAAIPRIDNQTEVLILQHRRERSHRFNTARLVERALRHATVLVDHTAGLADRLALKPRAGLLYPGPGAMLLTDLPPAQRPEQLVIVDGTWHHTKTFLRDIPALRHLPCYRLAPSEPSRYRIRREPSAAFLSTVEAAVAALRVLEPATPGLDQLLEAFDCMIERQLAHPKAMGGWRRNAARSRTYRNVPLALVGDPDRIVVAYGESAPRAGRGDMAARMPVYWAAQRLGTGERFACALQPPAPLPAAILGHLELTQDDFAQALSLAEARRAWAGFQRPDDVLTVYNPGTARLLNQMTARCNPCLVLKSVDFNPQRRYSTLDEVVAAERLSPAPVQFPGRAGKRLASAVALVEYLRALGGAAGGRPQPMA